VRTTAGAGTDDWDYFDTAMTNWANAYETLIDKRADLDIAKYYNDQLKLANGTDGVVANDAASYGVNGYIQKHSYSTTGALQIYNDAANDYTDAAADYDSSQSTYSTRAVLIASANSDYLLAQAQWEENNALISKLTVLSEIATAASDAAFTAEEDAATALEDATDDWEDAVIAYEGVAATEETEAVIGLVEE